MREAHARAKRCCGSAVAHGNKRCGLVASGAPALAAPASRQPALWMVITRPDKETAARPADSIKNDTFLRPRAPYHISRPTSMRAQRPSTAPSNTCICPMTASGKDKTPRVLEISRAPHRPSATMPIDRSIEL